MKKANLIVSATQLKGFVACQRSWAFDRVWRLPKYLKVENFGMGNVLHSVAERFFLADGTGRDPKTGKEVDLFPEGWTTWEERDGQKYTITDEEAELIKIHAENAQEKGIWVRRPGRKVEAKIWRPMDSRKGIFFIGFIDLLIAAEAEIQDHKTTKSKRWALSADKLAVDLQMNLYGQEVLTRFDDVGEEPPTAVTFRHNQFSKDPLDPWSRFVETEVPARTIRDTWKYCTEVAREMLELRKKVIDKGGPERYPWNALPGPENCEACNAYGGCPYLGICTRRETLERYIRRVNDLNKKRTTFKKEKTMGIFDQLSQKKAPEATKEEPKKFDCVACEDTGKNSKGDPCKACQARESKSAEDKAFAPKGEDKAKKKKGGILSRRKKSEAPQKEEPQKEEPKAEEPKAEEPKKEKPQAKEEKSEGKKRGRRRKGFTLLIDAVPVDTTVKTISMSKVVEPMKKDIAETLEAETFELADPFRRRDLMHKAVEVHLEDIGTAFVVARAGTADEKAWISALEAHAGTVIKGVA
jgi:hypothetical protein